MYDSEIPTEILCTLHNNSIFVSLIHNMQIIDLF